MSRKLKIELPKVSKPQLGCSNLLLFILCIADIAIGSMYLNECPQQPLIPIYLIVVGVFGLVMSLSSLFYNKWVAENCSSSLRIFYATLGLLTPFFLFCWFIAGNVWIYSIYVPNYNKNMTHVEPYCNKTLYQFAFWTTTLVYILLLFCCCCCCCSSGSSSGYSTSKSSKTTTSSTTVASGSSSVTVMHVSRLENSNSSTLDLGRVRVNVVK